MNTTISPIFFDDLSEAISTGKHIAWATERRAIVGESAGRFFAVSSGCVELTEMAWTTRYLVIFKDNQPVIL